MTQGQFEVTTLTITTEMINARGTGQWHSLKCLESGTVLLEAKDGAYHPLEEDEVMEV